MTGLTFFGFAFLTILFFMGSHFCKKHFIIDFIVCMMAMGSTLALNDAEFNNEIWFMTPFVFMVIYQIWQITKLRGTVYDKTVKKDIRR